MIILKRTRGQRTRSTPSIRAGVFVKVGSKGGAGLFGVNQADRVWDVIKICVVGSTVIFHPLLTPS